jgi:hypothetical protein
MPVCLLGPSGGSAAGVRSTLFGTIMGGFASGVSVSSVSSKVFVCRLLFLGNNCQWFRFLELEKLFVF